MYGKTRGDRADRDAGNGRGETARGKGKRRRTHTHTLGARDNGGELAERVETRCEQLGVLPRERGEGVCPLEAGHDQGNSVVPREFEGVSAADGCARSLGGMKTPGALVVARIPSVSVVPSVSVPVCVVESSVPVCVVASVVPVCMVSQCVYTSVAKCVLRRTHRTGERRCVRGAASVSATPCASVPPCATEVLTCSRAQQTCNRAHAHE